MVQIVASAPSKIRLIVTCLHGSVQQAREVAE
jgi:hypothetical protein